MKITFDPKSAADVADVAAILAALKPETTGVTGGSPSATPNPAPVVPAPAPAPVAATETPAPASAEDAFSGNPLDIAAAAIPPQSATEPTPVAPSTPPSTGPTATTPASPSSDAAEAFGNAPLSPEQTPASTPAPAVAPPPPEAAASSGPPPAPASTTSDDPAALYESIAKPPAAAAAAETDKNGLPWDARIHSGPPSKKPKNQDGTWRRKRGVGDDEVAAVEAELRQVMGAQPVAAAPLAPAPPPAAPPAAPPVAAAPAAPAPVASPPSVPAAPVSTASPADGATPAPSFTDLMRRITSLQTAGHLDNAKTGELCQSLNLTSVRDFVHRADMIPQMLVLLSDLGS